MSMPVIDTEVKASFALRGHNPDVLTCIANLSNDEVFTPPELANQMLDTLERAWAGSNHGESIWANATVTFLDPFTKSGVFLRQIVSRLTDGLADAIPDLSDRVDHILTKQVYGIGITQLTALLARRSVYCSKDAMGPHSVAKSFDRAWGNVWFERTEHTWVGRKKERRVTPDTDGEELVELRGTGKCEFCGAAEAEYARGSDLETHAYAFIHTHNIKSRIAELFGADMQFDVIIGNPPYQLSDAGFGTSATAIYHRFVEQAINLEPAYLTMVTPSRWFAGGKGVDRFRADMLTSGRLRTIVDYPNSGELFPDVDIKGGISYFLWDRNYRGDCEVTVVRHSQRSGPHRRDLGEFDVLVRDQRGLNILHKVLAFDERSLSDVTSARWAFGTELTSNFKNFYTPRKAESLRLYMQGGNRDIWVDPSVVTRNHELIGTWKVLLPKAGPGNSGGHVVPDMVLGRPIIAEPGSVCTLTYLVAGPLQDKVAANSLASYVRTRFVRFLVSLRKPSQDAPRGVYAWVPQQIWDRTWTDADLYAKYGITDDEIAFIETMVRPMEVNGV